MRLLIDFTFFLVDGELVRLLLRDFSFFFVFFGDDGSGSFFTRRNFLRAVGSSMLILDLDLLVRLLLLFDLDLDLFVRLLLDLDLDLSVRLLRDRLCFDCGGLGHIAVNS